MRELAIQYFAILLAQFQYDVQVLSTHPWMSYWVVPALLYAMFMVIKWGVLSMPLWVPTLLMSRAIRGWPVHLNIEPSRRIKFYGHSKN